MAYGWELIGLVSALIFWGGMVVFFVFPYLSALVHDVRRGLSRTPFRAALGLMALGIAVVYGGTKPSDAYMISFASCGGTGSMPEMSCRTNGVYNLSPCGFTAPSGKKFAGWWCPNTKKLYDDGVIVFNLGGARERVEMQAIWVDQ